MEVDQPLILTLQMDDASFLSYEELRRRHFPPKRNLISAHLTLFHQLPEGDDTLQVLRAEAEATEAFALTHPSLRSIGRGVAVFFESEPLIGLHARLSSAFLSTLIPQDRQRFRPHVVIQNKVEPASARALLEELKDTSMVAPHATGLTLWRYLGGPWERVTDLLFSAPALQ